MMGENRDQEATRGRGREAGFKACRVTWGENGSGEPRWAWPSPDACGIWRPATEGDRRETKEAP